ncbi:MAG: sulfite exporter TauE/SafE family protein [Acidobacteriota bacterium]|nr:sulfite exporter TauE/SafE family protein [Acidobacteriota bacterium]
MTGIELPWTIFPFFFLIAALYASAGQGGASGYLALFALFGIASPAVPPVALALNIIVASLSFLAFRKGGHFSARMFIPFAVTSIPAAFLGGLIPLASSVFTWLLGFSLLAAAAMTLRGRAEARESEPVPQKTLWSYGAPAGFLLGFLSGMVGIGGGVFLAPLILLAGWGDAKKAAALSSAFIAVNSVSGLTGHILRGNFDLRTVLVLSAAVIAGGTAGAYAGAGILPERTLRIILAAILAAGALKMLIG